MNVQFHPVARLERLLLSTAPNTAKTPSELARHIETARKIVTEAADNVPVRIVIDVGNPEEEIVRYARTEGADIVISPPQYKSLMKSAPCSVSLIPGTILVSVDNTKNSIMTLDRITREARAARSSRLSVILLGMGPIHLYNHWEKKEVSQVKAETLARIKQVRKLLVEQGIEVRDVLRSGYSNEEIVRTADEYSVSMIIMPRGGKEPSELSKAANILLDQPEQVKMPVVPVLQKGWHKAAVKHYAAQRAPISLRRAAWRSLRSKSAGSTVLRSSSFSRLFSASNALISDSVNTVSSPFFTYARS